MIKFLDSGKGIYEFMNAKKKINKNEQSEEKKVGLN